MQRRNDGKDKGCARGRWCERSKSNERANLKQENEKDSGDLRKSVGLAKNAGTKIPQAGDGEKHGAGGENGNVAAEDQHRKLPRNLVQDREHEKHRAQQKLVGDRVEILAEQSLLMECAGEQSIQAIAEARDNEDEPVPTNSVPRPDGSR